MIGPVKCFNCIRPAYWWSPTSNAHYCADCYRGANRHIADSEAHALELLARLSKEHDQLRKTHSRLVLAAWDELGDNILEILGKSPWAFRRTLEQIRGRPEAT